MDQSARDDIAAATAAHRELGQDYDAAVAEGLVERIGAEIDKRVDARLAGSNATAPARREGGQLSPAGRSPWPGTILALGSMGIGVTATAAVLNAANSIGPDGVVTTVGPGQVLLVIVIWVIIGVINVALARRR
jgi:hypothetical protein